MYNNKTTTFIKYTPAITLHTTFMIDTRGVSAWWGTNFFFYLQSKIVNIHHLWITTVRLLAHTETNYTKKNYNLPNNKKVLLKIVIIIQWERRKGMWIAWIYEFHPWTDKHTIEKNKRICVKTIPQRNRLNLLYLKKLFHLI